MTTLTTTEPAVALRALADPVRARICELLAAEELCVCHLVDELGLSQSLLSHHLKTLRAAGLVESRKHSYWSYYRLVPSALEDAGGWLLELAERAAGDTSARPCCP